MECYRIKDEIINFVLNSPEEVNSNVAIFIAGMQAQKRLMSYGQKAEDYKRMPNEDYTIDLKIGLMEK